MPKTRVICIGACAIDTILTVPYFPEEDSKLRATAFARRRGGNSPNSLEVLQQLLEDDETHSNSGQDNETALELFLVVPLPARQSADCSLIASSFGLPTTRSSREHDERKRTRVDLSQCIYREDSPAAVSSYIISSQATSSRTIINNNALQEMSFDEFVKSFQNITRIEPDQDSWTAERFWFHFEGRIPPTTQRCIQYIRNHPAFERNEAGKEGARLIISVELEKPGREGLQELMYVADVVFYSKAWAKGLRYESAEDCLRGQVKILLDSPWAMSSRDKLLVCTWGEQGACALRVPGKPITLNDFEKALLLSKDIVHSPAYDCSGREIIDSTGAGDTFIAAMLYGFLCRDQAAERSAWSVKQMLDFANGLAGRKILQDGFSGLGESSRELRSSIGSGNR